MRIEGVGPRSVEDDVAKVYLDGLVEFSKRYDIPTFFNGRIRDATELSVLDLTFSNHIGARFT
ncbi:MAG: hypothetical protein AAFV19_22585, partial [Pseudomonadota bacterium]